jgi:hypothetical protein
VTSSAWMVWRAAQGWCDEQRVDGVTSSAWMV